MPPSDSTADVAARPSHRQRAAGAAQARPPPSGRPAQRHPSPRQHAGRARDPGERPRARQPQGLRAGRRPAPSRLERLRPPRPAPDQDLPRRARSAGASVRSTPAPRWRVPGADGKLAFAVGLAAGLAYVALRQSNPVRVVILADGGAARLSPLLRHVQRLPDLLQFLAAARGARRRRASATASMPTCAPRTCPAPPCCCPTSWSSRPVYQTALDRLRGARLPRRWRCASSVRTSATRPHCRARCACATPRPAPSASSISPPAHRARYARALDDHLAQLTRWCAARAIGCATADTARRPRDLPARRSAARRAAAIAMAFVNPAAWLFGAPLRGPRSRSTCGSARAAASTSRRCCSGRRFPTRCVRTSRFRPDWLFVLQCLLLALLIAGLADPYLGARPGARRPDAARCSSSTCRPACRRARRATRASSWPARRCAERIDGARRRRRGHADRRRPSTARRRRVHPRPRRGPAPSRRAAAGRYARQPRRRAGHRARAPPSCPIVRPRSSCSPTRRASSSARSGATASAVVPDRRDRRQPRHRGPAGRAGALPGLPRRARLRRGAQLRPPRGARRAHPAARRRGRSAAAASRSRRAASAASRSRSCPAPGVLRASLEVDDALAVDNLAYAYVRPVHPLRVLAVTDIARPAGRPASASPPRRPTCSSPSSLPADYRGADGADVVLFHRVAPPFPPDAASLYIAPAGAEQSVHHAAARSPRCRSSTGTRSTPPSRGLRPELPFALSCGAGPRPYRRGPMRCSARAPTAARSRSPSPASATASAAPRSPSISPTDNLLSADHVNLLLVFLNLLDWLAPADGRRAHRAHRRRRSRRSPAGAAAPHRRSAPAANATLPAEHVGRARRRVRRRVPRRRQRHRRCACSPTSSTPRSRTSAAPTQSTSSPPPRARRRRAAAARRRAASAPGSTPSLPHCCSSNGSPRVGGRDGSAEPRLPARPSDRARHRRRAAGAARCCSPSAPLFFVWPHPAGRRASALRAAAFAASCWRSPACGSPRACRPIA